ncbi:MAG: chitinase N-terminal domain-containing protein [Dehalococcoidia bacterium]|nr:chitinase N-terminal domain-containing protein [Dehalococcoidia bacterium]
MVVAETTAVMMTMVETAAMAATHTTGITLEVTAYKVRGLQKADLVWSGATTDQVAIHRDGEVIATVDNTGEYTDDIDQRGGGTYVYQVCEVDSNGNPTSVCSPEVTAEF